MKHGNELFELKLHELSFIIKKLEIHQKLHATAALEFSEKFKQYIDSIEDRATKHKLRQIAGLASENERPMTKTAKRAKQAGQHRKGKNKIKNQEEPEQTQTPPPPPPPSQKVPPEYKSLYRKVAQQLHPDKVGDDEKKATMLQEVNGAITTGDFFKLIEMAIKMEIEIPPEVNLNLEDINQKIETNKKKIKNLTKSVAWEWYHLDEDASRKKLIKAYADFLVKNK